MMEGVSGPVRLIDGAQVVTGTSVEVKFMGGMGVLHHNLSQHHQRKMLSESECGYDMTSAKTGHSQEPKQMVQKELREFQCDGCEFKSLHSSAVKRHKEMVHMRDKQTRHTCSCCDYSTLYKSALKRHIANRHNKDSLVQFQCSFCDYTSTYEFAVERHISTVHIKHKDGEYTCSICEYNTMHKFSMDRHTRIVHQRELKYKCEECEFRSGHKSALRMHVATVHSSRRAYSCSVCGLETLYKTALMRHMNTANCKSGFKVVGAGNLLRQELEQTEESKTTSEYKSALTEERVPTTSPNLTSTSPVNFSKPQDGYNTSVTFNADSANSSITILEQVENTSPPQAEVNKGWTHQSTNMKRLYEDNGASPPTRCVIRTT